MSDELSTEEVESLSDVMGDVPSEGEKPPEEAETPNGTAVETPETTTTSDESPAEEPTDDKGQQTPSILRAQFVQLEDSGDNNSALPPHELEWMKNVLVNVQVELGSTKMPLQEILKLQPESVVELKKMAGEPVEICANGKVIARGEVIAVEDQFGVKILDIYGTKQQLEVLGS